MTTTTDVTSLPSTPNIADNVPIPAALVDFETERAQRKKELAASLRLFAKFGYDEGVAGHITARDPEDPHLFWVNPFGMYFGHIRASDLIAVDSEGKVVYGNQPVNRAAFAIHSQIHAARPDVVGAAHSHSIYGKAWSSLGRLLSPITQDACSFYEDHVLFDDYSGVVLDTSEGQRIAQTLGDKKAAILRNHGLLTVGHTVSAAAWFFIAMDRSCQAELAARAAGEPVLIGHDNATLTRGQVGSQLAGWFSFQPMLNMMLREQPDLVE